MLNLFRDALTAVQVDISALPLEAARPDSRSRLSSQGRLRAWIVGTKGECEIKAWLCDVVYVVIRMATVHAATLDVASNASVIGLKVANYVCNRVCRVWFCRQSYGYCMVRLRLVVALVIVRAGSGRAPSAILDLIGSARQPHNAPATKFQHVSAERMKIKMSFVDGGMLIFIYK